MTDTSPAFLPVILRAFFGALKKPQSALRDRLKLPVQIILAEDIPELAERVEILPIQSEAFPQTGFPQF